jgi:hypothetical protein
MEIVLGAETQDRRQTERGNGDDRRQDSASQKAKSESVGNVSGEFKKQRPGGRIERKYPVAKRIRQQQQGEKEGRGELKPISGRIGTNHN